MDDGDSCPVLESYRKLNSVYNYLNKRTITSDNFSLGHGLKNSVVEPFMANISLARYQCLFKKGKNNEWTLEDNSTFGIKINGVTLGNGLEKKLCDGDIISLERTDELVYRFLNSPSKEIFEVPRKRLKNERKWNGIEEHLRAEINRKVENRILRQINKFKGGKNEVECQKTIVSEERDAQLETIIHKMKMSTFMDRKNSLASLHLCPPMPLLAPVALTRGSKGSPLPVGRSPPPRRGADKMREREEIQKQLSEAQYNAEKMLAAERIQKQAEQSEATNRILHEQLGKLKFQLQTLETERNTILEDICAPENCGEGSSKEVVLNEMGELMESELQCSICNEVFVEPTTLNCSHTFCKYCISVWKKNKKDCPICRASIKSECKSLALNSFIEKMVQSLSDEMKQKRKEILEERKGL